MGELNLENDITEVLISARDLLGTDELIAMGILDSLVNFAKPANFLITRWEYSIISSTF